MRARSRLLAVVLVAGCGGGDISGELERARDRAERIRENVKERVEQARDRRYLPLS